MIIQFAISRQREFAADAAGAKIAGTPHGLASALLRLEEASHRMAPMAVNPAVSHMYIANPLSGRSLMNLFSTHPSIAERVRRLQTMG
jgi:heat shock protein HtpX